MVSRAERAAAALPVADAVLRLVGVVGVRGPVGVLEVRRRPPGARPCCAPAMRDRRAERLALEDAGEDLGAVGLLARRGDRGSARAGGGRGRAGSPRRRAAGAAGSRRRRRRRRRRATRRRW